MCANRLPLTIGRSLPRSSAQVGCQGKHSPDLQSIYFLPSERKVKLFDETKGEKTALGNYENSAVSNGLNNFLQVNV